MRRLAPLVFLALPGCASGGNHPIRPLRPLELATAPYSAVSSSRLTGSLMYEGGCLLFRDDQGRPALLPVWPTGSIFDGTSVIFHEPGHAEQPILIAQHFVMEGRKASWSELPTESFAPFQHQCAAQPFMVSEVSPAD